MEEKKTEEYKEAFKRLLLDTSVSDEFKMKYLNKLNASCNVKSNKSFFRFRPFNDNTLKEIINQEVYLSKLSDYDDVYEGRYLIDDQDLKEGINIFQVEDCNKFYRENVRGTSFTTNNKNIPMWYYYADKHKGICIEYKYEDFHLPSDVVFLPIIYPKNYEEHKYKYLPQKNELMNFGAVVTSLVKNRSWEFEKEWRIIKVSNESNPVYVPLKMNRIHLGANASESTRAVIKNLIEKNNLDIRLKEMILTSSGLASFDFGIIPKEHRAKV